MQRGWYFHDMSGTHNVVMGDRGRVVVPALLRKRAGMAAGDPLVFVESEQGLLLLTREQLRARVKQDFRGLNLVEELLAERRVEAEYEAPE